MSKDSDLERELKALEKEANNQSETQKLIRILDLISKGHRITFLHQDEKEITIKFRKDPNNQI